MTSLTETTQPTDAAAADPVRAEPCTDVAELERRGGYYNDRGEFRQAIDCCRAIVRLAPESPHAHASLGDALARIGQLEEAAEHYRQSLALEPAESSIHARLGTALMQLARYEQAVSALSEAVRLNPEDVAAHNTLARALRLTARPAEALGVLESLVRRAPDNVEAIHHLATMLRDVGKAPEASVLLRHAARLCPRSAETYNLLGISEMSRRLWDEAEAAFQEALRLDPRSVAAHTNLAVAYKRQERTDEAVTSFELALRLHRVKPRHWQPTFPRETAELSLLLEQRSFGLPPEPSPEKWLTVAVGCYGDFPDYSLRALESIAGGREMRRHCDLLIGLNECCPRTTARARDLADSGTADAVLESRHNRNKDPILRQLIELARTPYVLWLDDDSHFTDDRWPQAFARAVCCEHPFDAAGQHARWGPRRDLDRDYARFVRARPWWGTDKHYADDLREWVPFVVGGMFIIRTRFARRHDFPDRGMLKAMDDVALGELIQQVGGRLLPLPRDLLAMVRISDGQRRGVNFLLTDGWEPHALTACSR